MSEGERPFFADRTVFAAAALIALALMGATLVAEFGVRSALPEITYLERHLELTFPELSKYFSGIADEKGALYAIDVLRQATLPPNTDTHLLGHVVGGALYAEKGVAGIADCTEEFRNACSHSIVIGVFDESGEAGIADIREACRDAPGGGGAYTMCFHGLGHGVFAYTGHDLSATAALCKKTGTPAYRDREYIECFGGAIMELVGGMGHDMKSLVAARTRYFPPEDPLSPCDRATVPGELKPICYLYLTPQLFAFRGGDLGHPGEREIRQAFSLCERIPKEEEARRAACFEGIGKELPSLVAQRDIRAIDAISPEGLGTLHAQCALSGGEEGRERCIRSIVQSLFWGGENDPRAAVAFCGGAADGGAKEACYDELFAANRFYNADDAAARNRVCASVPPGYAAECAASLQRTP